MATTTANNQQLRILVGDVLVQYGMLEQERARTSFNYLVTAVAEQLPNMQTEEDTQEMVRRAVHWYFQADPFPDATLTAAAQALWVGRRYGWLYTKVVGILGEADIPEIGSFSTLDFHDEAQVILPQLPRARNQADVERIVTEEFRGWFSDNRLSGDAERQRASWAAGAIWKVWLQWKREHHQSEQAQSRAGTLLQECRMS